MGRDCRSDQIMPRYILSWGNCRPQPDIAKSFYPGFPDMLILELLIRDGRRHVIITFDKYGSFRKTTRGIL
jgi:hypothetical protein